MTDLELAVEMLLEFRKILKIREEGVDLETAAILEDLQLAIEIVAEEVSQMVAARKRPEAVSA